LFGYHNRPDGAFSNVKVSEMPVGDVIDFTDPSGTYGRWVKSQLGYTATPVGAYQVVGTTLRDAVKALGIDPKQKFDKATQDKIGQYILKTQGTGAWEGYGKGGASMDNKPAQMAQPQQQQPQGLLGGILGGQGIGGALGLNDDFRDKLAMAIMAGSGDPRLQPLIQMRAESLKERRAETKEQRQRNKSLEYLKQRADAGDAMAGQIYGAVSTGVLPVGAGVSEYLTQSLKGNGITDTTDYKNYSEYVKGMENPISFKEYMDAKDLQPIQNKGTYRYDNRIIGEVMFDPNKGEFFETVNGQRVPIDISKAQPVTDATFAKAIPNYGDFVKLSEGLSEDRTSMDRLQSYMKSIGNTNEGFQRLGDQMTASLKTLLSGIAGPEWTSLSKEELNAAVAQGQLQGLIGRFRIETVGGGVMTEQDALRIIANLGGDVNALQNKEIVAQQIETLFRGKLKSFDSKRKRHDAAIDALYGGMGFDKVDEYEFDEDVFNLRGSVSDGKATMTDDQLLYGAQGKTGAALSQYLQSLSEADFNRLMQLQQ
jgi:hypothetical protein